MMWSFLDLKSSLASEIMFLNALRLMVEGMTMIRIYRPFPSQIGLFFEVVFDSFRRAATIMERISAPIGTRNKPPSKRSKAAAVQQTSNERLSFSLDQSEESISGDFSLIKIST